MRILKSQKGFTLIEMTVVIAITGILAVLLSAFFVNIVQGNVNATVTTRVRSQGEVVIEQIARAIRDSNDITISGTVPTVPTTTNTITLSQNGGTLTTYSLTGTFVQVNGFTLNASDVLVDNSTNCSGSLCSYFVVNPGTSTSPAQVKVVITFYTLSGNGFHSEFATRETLTQSSVQLGQYKK